MRFSKHTCTELLWVRITILKCQEETHVDYKINTVEGYISIHELQLSSEGLILDAHWYPHNVWMSILPMKLQQILNFFSFVKIFIFTFVGHQWNHVLSIILCIVESQQSDWWVIDIFIMHEQSEWENITLPINFNKSNHSLWSFNDSATNNYLVLFVS